MKSSDVTAGMDFAETARNEHGAEAAAWIESKPWMETQPKGKATQGDLLAKGHQLGD